jgi:tetratricopeptide (TPR) repeat protein
VGARRNFRLCFVLVALSLSPAGLLAAPAPAPPAPAAEDAAAQAKSYYLQGDRAFNLGKYDEALGLFEKAYNLKPVAGLLFNVAQCHRLLGNLEQARRVYRAFINQTGDTKLKAAAQEKLAEVEGVIEAQTKSRSSNPTSLAQVEKLSPPPLPGEPEGAAREASKPAAVSMAERSAQAAQAQKPRPAAPDAATGKVAARPSPASTSSHITAWSALGAGVLAAGGGVFFGLQSRSASDALAAGGLDRATADQKAKTLQDDAKLGNLLLIGGAVLLAGAGAAWLLDAP